MDDLTAYDGARCTRAYQRRVHRHPMTVQCGQIVQRFDEVGLADPVRADQHATAGRELDDDVRVRPEVDELEPADEHYLWTACPPNWLRSAATAFIAGESSCRDRNRANSEAAMTFIGTASRIASSTVHRPSPVSSAYPRSCASLGSSSSARSSRSSSQDWMTVPDRQDLTTAGTSVTYSDASSSSNPSA